MNLLPDHLRYEFYVRYYGSPAKALAIVTDLQALEIARALVERDLEFPKTEQPCQPSPGCRQSGVAPEGPGSGVYKPLMRKPRGPDEEAHADRDTAGTLLPPVTDPQSYSRNDARKGSAGVNLKDLESYLKP